MVEYVVFSATCLDGEMRLMDGETEMEGRLELCLGQRWGTVSNEGWTETDAEVVCRDLGYEIYSKCDSLQVYICCK